MKRLAFIILGLVLAVSWDGWLLSADLSAVSSAEALAKVEASAKAEETPLDAARTLFLKGQYEDARKALGAIVEADASNERAAELLAELDIELGRFEDAERRCDDFLRTSPRSARVRAAYAWALFERGQLDRAYQEARKVQVLEANNLDGRYLEALILYMRGEHVVAKRIFETFVDVWQDTPEEKLSAEDATLVGRACTYFALADRNPSMLKTIVNQVYPLAVKKDGIYTPAMVASGMLFLEKYNTVQAEKEFAAALRVNPNHPLALVGLARCRLEDHRFSEAHELLERAAAVAANLPEVRLLDATLSICDEDYEEALLTAGKALAVNPNHQEALGLKAACLYQLDRKEDYALAEKKALDVNPKCSLFYETVASVLITRHRDAEAEPLLRHAMELSPNDSGPPALLGLLLMRLGKEKDAYAVLDKAYAMDTFNTIVVNTLNLLDKMKDFEVRKTAHFTIKAHPETDRVLVDYAAEYLESMYPEVVGHYRHEPPHTLIEIFPDHRMFSVRTTGVPNVGTVGACLGPTIVMDSPAAGSAGTFNWEDVLRHEFTHAVTLSATDMRISHWFTEALAVSEERHGRPYAWHQMIVDALDRGEFLPVTKLNYGFTRSRTQRRRQLAYTQSHLIAEFIGETWGSQKLVEMLEHYRRGEDTAGVIASVFAMKPEAFDAKFLDYVKGVAAKFEMHPSPVIRNQDEVEKKIAEKPKDAELHLELARIKLARGDVTGAAAAVAECLKLQPTHARACAVLGAIRLQEKNVEEARKAFEKALTFNPRETGAIRGLVEISQREKNDDAALTYLKKLSAVDGRNPGVYRALAHIHLKKNDARSAAENFAKAAELDSQDYASRRELVRLMIERPDYDSAARYVDQAIAIWPYDRQLHEWGALAFDKLGRKERAEREKALIPLSKPYRAAPADIPPSDKPVEH
jgi:tetratricopeptide (TPR) repeat protein